MRSFIVPECSPGENISIDRSSVWPCHTNRDYGLCRDQNSIAGAGVDINVRPLERQELRKIWDHEAKHFTPWLYLPETLEQLGKAVGLGRINGVGCEQPVGSFRADIVARDLSGGHVLIENQLKQTDHSHLGQLLTYAAGLTDASSVVSVIWVAARIRPEHADALRWLNARTPENVGFYAVEITAWTISGSAPGYKFEVVVRPDTTVQAGVAAETPLTDGQLALRNYWSEFRNFLDERGAQHWVRPKLPKSGWWGRNMGWPGVNLAAVVEPAKSKFISVMLELSDPSDYIRLFDGLQAERPQIDRELQAGLKPEAVIEWYSTQDRRYIRTIRAGVDVFDAKEQDEQFEWMLNYLERYRSAFWGRITRLTDAASNSAA